MYQRQRVFKDSWESPLCLVSSARLSCRSFGPSTATAEDLPLLGAGDVWLKLQSFWQRLHLISVPQNECPSVFLLSHFKGTKMASSSLFFFGRLLCSVSLFSNVRLCTLWNGTNLHLTVKGEKVRAGFSFKDTTIIKAYLRQYAGSLCCFILEEWKSKKSPQNSPARGTAQEKQSGVGSGKRREKSRKEISNRAFQNLALLKPALTFN